MNHAPALTTLRGWLQRIGPGARFALRHQNRISECEAATDDAQAELSRLSLESVVEVSAKAPAHSAEAGAGGGAWRVLELRCLAKAEALPFVPAQAATASAAQRSRYRYLALREGPARTALLLRHRIVQAFNIRLDELGFIGVETPLLATPSASGAREFRVRNADATLDFALPQSAQLYGQLLVAAGVERYAQWSRCFRDEDLRANRQPEFTQLHIECAFSDPAALRRMFETLLVEACESCGVMLHAPFDELRHADCIARYGEDKPELRWGLRLRSLPFILGDAVANPQAAIRSLAQLLWRSEDAALSAALVTELPKWCASHCVELLGYASQKLAGERYAPRNWNRSDLSALDGFAAEWRADCYPLLWGDARALDALHLSVYRSLREGCHALPRTLHFSWVVEFPMFSVDEHSPDRLAPVNSPYTAPADAAAFGAARKHRDRLQLRSTAFDLVCNGEEIASGSSVITDSATLRSVFEAMGLARQQIRAGYHVWLDALRWGVPPMTGIGLGLDRLIACLMHEPKIRSVMAFPKTKQGHCPVTDPAGERVP